MGYIEDAEATPSSLISPRQGYSKLGVTSIFSPHGHGWYTYSIPGEIALVETMVRSPGLSGTEFGDRVAWMDGHAWIEV